MNDISIIIPVLNEEGFIAKLLEHLIANSTSGSVSEIIIVDGGSTDNTNKIVSAISNFNRAKNKDAYHFIDLKKAEENDVTIKKETPKITLLKSLKGRAKQMNLGAKSANGSIFYFLHADSFPPKNFDNLIIQEVKKGNRAGCFRMQFDSKHWWLRLASWLTQFNWRPCRGGDQSQFITRSLFNEIGGYDESYTIYEDNILINELYARKVFVVINKKIRTSARLYKKHGIWKLQYYFWSIYVKRWLGANANALYSYYQKKISRN